MTARIKFLSFRFLFRLFDFLAEKSGGWAMFVRPKMVIGSLILGLTLSSCGKKTPHPVTENEQNLNPDTLMTDCYVTIPVGHSKELENEIFVVAEQMPEFKGGDKALSKFIKDNIKYPKEALKKKEQGRVIGRFCVLKDGSIDSIRILRGVSPSIDNEAIRVIKLMPKWIPGKQGGKPSTVWYTIPLVFELPKN